MDPGYFFRTEKNISKFSDQVSFGRIRFTYEQRRRFSGPVLRAFFNISNFWKLNAKEEMRLLGVKSYQGLGRRRRGKVILTSNELVWLGWIFIIYKKLYILFSDDADSRRDWMKKPNNAPMFGGKSAMEYIMDTDMPMERILSVRNYLKS